MRNSQWQQWGILGNERKFDPVDEGKTERKKIKVIQSLEQKREINFLKSRQKPVPAAAVRQVGQRSRSWMGLKRDKIVKGGDLQKKTRVEKKSKKKRES